MNKLLILAFLFASGCIIGWCIEVLFRRFSPSNQSRRFINPGFLVGPYLPLYGFCLCVLYLLASIEKYISLGNPVLNKFVLFIIMAVSMTLLEYIAGLIFIKGMHVKLWDYSKMKGNIQGIICPQFSLAWAFLGAIYYFFIHPYILGMLNWFSNNLAFSFFIGLFYGVFLIDVCYSFHIVSKIRAFARDNNILVKYEELKEQIQRTALERKEKYKFLFALRSSVPLKEHLRELSLKQKQALKELSEKINSKKS